MPKHRSRSSALSTSSRCCYFTTYTIHPFAPRSTMKVRARLNKSWRFYFLIQDDVYYIVDIVPHPK